ncbi:MATE family efflux transporter [Clostridiaceae bacterium OttesenSCG-928-D20]|nr:MATE family efflux transporter [Clostridiaceae bacterium OttesenSCG-928-D20]
MKNNMTEGNGWRQIIRFSIPLMLGSLLQQLYNTVDGIVVGNFVGESALAAVGSSTALSMVFLAAAIGFGNGAGIMISQYYGAHMEKDLKLGCSTSMIMMISLGAALSLLGALFSRVLCDSFMKIIDPVVLEYSIDYFRIFSLGLVFVFAYNIIASILRAIGDSKATLYFLLVSAVINVVLDLLFVVVFHWGVVGVAVATVIAEGVSALVSLIYMIKKYPMFRFKKGEFRFDREKCRVTLRLGIPTTLQQMVVSLGNVFIQRLVNSFGEITMSAYTVGLRVESYIAVPIMAFNVGVATFTGQNIGAGKPERVRAAVTRIMGVVFLISAAVAAVAFAFAEPLSRLFGVSGETLKQAIEHIRFLSIFFPFFSVNMIIGGVLQGSGDVIFSTLRTLLSLTTRVVGAYFMVYALGLGYASTWQATPIGWGLILFISIPRYLGKKWENKGIVKLSDNMGGESFDE